jgi:putative pyruvate formate lyase activating enzyme
MLKEHFEEYSDCTLCPRNCRVNRNAEVAAKNFCGESSHLSIDNALLHHGEEPPISFKNGSGTIFFTGCSLKCPFCQNIQISRSLVPHKYYTTAGFVGMMENLIGQGAENINFVTPDHFLPHIIEGVKYIRGKGYKIPFVYNCSGFQSIENLKEAVKYIDIFLFDYKFAEIEAAEYCINNKKYPEVAAQALRFLYNEKGNLKLDGDGRGQSGVIVRHLVMPDFIENSISVINDIFFDYGNDIYLSLMSQYSPFYLESGFDRIRRRLKKFEYQEVLDLVENLDFKNGFIQDYIDYNDEYLPDFKTKDVFDQK